MSIATEIARIQQAKADLKASINAKGGTITDETIDEYASKVTALPSPKEEETKTVTPNFSSGNQVITPTTGKVMTQVTINKDGNLIADNIKSGVTIFGITGTYEGSGGVAVSGTYAEIEVRSAPISATGSLSLLEIYAGTKLLFSMNKINYGDGGNDGRKIIISDFAPDLPNKVTITVTGSAMYSDGAFYLNGVYKGSLPYNGGTVTFSNLVFNTSGGNQIIIQCPAM